MSAKPEPTTSDVAAWWGTAISRMEPNVIELRGHPVQDLIGTTSLTEMIWLMLRGDRPTAGQARLLEAALVAAVDHGPHAPSIAIARMAATCGVGLNNAVANGVNVLGDNHGGAGEQCLALLGDICDRADSASISRDRRAPSISRDRRAPSISRDRRAPSIDEAAAEVLAAFRAHTPYVPGFGHRFHQRDPRRDPLLSLVDRAVTDGVVAGHHLAAGLAVERSLRTRDGRSVPMNIDGATAVIFGELGFPPPLARGLFVLSRSVGILAHAWEETQQGRRNKGPIPPGILPAYLSQ